MKDPEFLGRLNEIHPDLIVVAAFGRIIPKVILDLPAYGCVNVHASLLPAWRGASPIQHMILNGDRVGGVTIMRMDEGLDTGDIISVKEVPLSDDETGGSLFDKLAVVGGNLCCMALTAIEEGVVTPVPQDESKATKVGMIKKELGLIDFSRPAEEIARYVRGLNPWPCTYTFYNGKILKIWRAKRDVFLENMFGEELIGDTMAKDTIPGTVVHVNGKHLLIQTGEGFLSVEEVQMEGKRRMWIEDFLNGNSVSEGELIGN
jgi:methionyl-tRNA formyltransferase